MRKLLIANRGEIARRIIRTAHRLGLETVAVYSDADANAPHVREAGEAVRLGPAPARESYLRIDRIVEACRQTGADAAHPGYGFLSENAEFAQALSEAGITFVGPPVDAIRIMGLKDAAKDAMKAAGVPVTPGYQGADQAVPRLERAAKAIGYPLLIKAVAGGGGKGMRRVEAEREFAEALIAAKREAAAAFGNDGVMLEKLIQRPRHVEVQIFADGHGNVVHLFERDCSLQRRHQKVIEEAPAPGLSEQLRHTLGVAAVVAGTAIGYVGAGTVEFILDMDDVDEVGDPRFYFMEMNTRLQVEHPVTEMITGLDLVEWQLRVATGAMLPLSQDAIELRGHAVEARLYAEDPDAGFLPQAGRLSALAFPRRAGVRVDSGVEAGGEVTIHYDPMIAKVIAYGPDRATAIDRLVDALDGTQVEGLRTNRAFLARLADHPAFRDGEIDTGFIARHMDELTAAAADLPDAPLVAAAALAEADVPPASPYAALGGWRLNGPARRYVDLYPAEGGPIALVLERAGDGWRFPDEPDAPAVTLRRREGGLVEAEVGERRLRCTLLVDRAGVELRAHGRSLRYERAAPPAKQAAGGSGRVTAPMPGRVLALFVAPGQRVEAGDRLLVLEAMKMEHRLTAGVAGTVKAVAVAENAQVSDGALLVEIEAEG